MILNVILKEIYCSELSILYDHCKAVSDDPHIIKNVFVVSRTTFCNFILFGACFGMVTVLYD